MARRSSTEPARGRSGLALAGTIGGYVIACLVIGLVVGLLLDRVTGTSPLFLIAGVVVGFVLSFYLIYRLAMGELAE